MQVIISQVLISSKHFPDLQQEQSNEHILHFAPIAWLVMLEPLAQSLFYS